MKKTLAGLLGLVAIAFAAPAVAQNVPSGKYALDKTHASVNATVKHLGLAPYSLRFKTFDISIELDADDISKSTVSATIDPKSVETLFPGAKDFNGEVAGFLGGDQMISFKSTKVEKTGDNTATITGDLTMLGVTKEITLEAELSGFIAQHPFAKKPAVGFTAQGVFDRTEFGSNQLANELPNGASIVSKEVEIVVSAEFVKAN